MTPLPISSRTALQVSYLLSAVGAFALWHGSGGPVAEAGFEELDWSEAAYTAAGSIATWATVALSVLCAIPTRSRHSLLHQAWLLLAVVTILVSAARTIHQTYRPELVFACHAVRWLGPIGVWLLLRQRGAAAGEWLLRIAVAATFVGHGLEALDHNARFVDYIYSTGALLGQPHDEAVAQRLLTGIGLLDLVVAAVLLLIRSPAVALWMTCWGLLTAFARMVHHGSAGWPETAIRATNAGLPLALALWWRADRASRD